MRSIKTFLVVLIFTMTILSADAQAPGYLGKRFIVNYDIYTMPALSNPNANGNKGITSFNFRQAFSVDYVTSLSQSVGMSFHLTKSQFEFDRGFEYSYDNSSGYQQTEYLNYGDTKGELSAYAIGLHTNLYFKQFIAPLGTYFKPEILLFNIKTTFDQTSANKNMDKSLGHTLESYPLLANKESYTTVALGATIGTHYIFFNRLVFNVGFQLGYVFGGKVMSKLMENDGSTINNLNEENYISVSAKSRLMSQYFFNVNAGLGLLIF